MEGTRILAGRETYPGHPGIVRELRIVDGTVETLGWITYRYNFDSVRMTARSEDPEQLVLWQRKHSALTLVELYAVIKAGYNGKKIQVSVG